MNNALHLWFRLLAEELNAAGYDFKKFLEVSEYKLDIPFSETLIKEVFWREFMKGMTGQSSTTDLTPFECSKVQETMSARIAEKTGVYVEFPHEPEECHSQAAASHR